MDLKQLISSISPEVYQRLSSAVETGKWPDGVALTPEQKENCLQLVMLWQMQHNTTPEHMTIGSDGEIVIKSKQQLKQEFDIQETRALAENASHESIATPIVTFGPQ